MTGGDFQGSPASAREHPRSPEEVVELIQELVRSAQGLVAARARVAGLSQNEYLALLYVVGADGLTGADLRHTLGMSAGSITELADRLERGGLMSRARRPSDRRRVVLRPTPRGRRKIARTLGPVLEMLAGILHGMPESERAAVAWFLHEVALGIDGKTPSRPARQG